MDQTAGCRCPWALAESDRPCQVLDETRRLAGSRHDFLQIFRNRNLAEPFKGTTVGPVFAREGQGKFMPSSGSLRFEPCWLENAPRKRKLSVHRICMQNPLTFHGRRGIPPRTECRLPVRGRRRSPDVKVLGHRTVCMLRLWRRSRRTTGKCGHLAARAFRHAATGFSWRFCGSLWRRASRSGPSDEVHDVVHEMLLLLLHLLHELDHVGVQVGRLVGEVGT